MIENKEELVIKFSKLADTNYIAEMIGHVANDMEGDQAINGDKYWVQQAQKNLTSLYELCYSLMFHNCEKELTEHYRNNRNDEQANQESH